MPYVKNSIIAGAKDSIEITSIHIDIDQKTIFVGLRSSTIDGTGIPHTQIIDVSLRDENKEITDPAWNVNSNPSKPSGYIENNPATWGGLTYDQIPKVIDPASQHFSVLAASNPDGTTIYGRLKNGIYAALANSGLIPNIADGWVVQ